MSLNIDLRGRVYVVSGAARGGISGGVARRIAAAGGAVACVDNQPAVLEETLADVRAGGGTAQGFVIDLMDPAQTDTLVPQVLRHFGRLDGVANVAGGTREQDWVPLERTPLDIFRETLNLNLEYVFRVCRDVAASMIGRKVPGSLVNVGSISALTSAPWHGPYGAAKSGIAALTRTMANEWQYYRIRANTVSPGAVMTQRVRERAAAANVVAGSNRNFTAIDDVANAIVFLLSDLAAGISGQTLVVDSALSTKFCAGERTPPKV